jgi:hypothetical protein
MKKKSKKKATKSRGLAPEKGDAAKQEIEKTFDFGGLPERDIKKNLGCG